MHERGKHIAILTPGFAANEADSTCIPVLQQFVMEYKESFPEDTLSIFSIQYPFEKGSYDWHGISCWSAGGKNNSFPLRLLTWKQLLQEFEKIHRRQKIDLIQSFWLTEATFTGRYLSRKFRLPLVATGMGQDCKKENRYLRFMRADDIKITTISPFIAGLLQKEHAIHVHKIIPLGEYRLPGQLPQAMARPIDIIGVGSLIPLKNYCLFVEVVAALKNEFPHINCLIIGDTSDTAERDSVWSLIRKYGLDDHILLTGRLPYRDVEKYMNSSKVFLHTSVFEGQGAAITEALYSGLPVVCFPVGMNYPEKMSICGTKEEMISAVRKLLQTPDFVFDPYIPVTMKNTVYEYHELYHKEEP